MSGPLVHLNGTSVSTLNEAMNALYMAAPNARDYYPLGEGAFETARNRHEARISVVAGVQKECMAILEGIGDQAMSR